MTWYRVGPAGIPGSLKTDMDAVLNKKFGTSTTYAPNTWPDNVNLLGPLPEKTASGAIANITDGADGVPLKNWLVTLPASLDGYTEVNGVQTGKNLFNINASSGTPDPTDGSNTTSPRVLEVDKFFIGLRSDNYYYPQYANVTIQNNSITVTNGSNNAYGACYCFEVKEGVDYTISVTCSDNYILSVGAYSETWAFLGGVGTAVSNASKTFTAPTSARYCVCVLRSAANASATFTNVQIEAGSTATAYEAYTAPTQYTASLGRTIYGGTADIATGEGEDGYGYIVFDGSNDENWGGYSAYNGYYIGISDMKSGTRQDGVCNQLTCSKSTAQGQTDAFWLGVGNNRLYVIGVYDSMGNTLEAFRSYLSENPLILVYPLATSTAFTFTPITPTPETALGVNNFWADEGDSDVTYRADISLALQALGGGGRGLMGMMMQRPEEEQLTEEDPEEVPEEAETNER